VQLPSEPKEQEKLLHGITIWVYRPDHPPAHFHAQYGEHWAQISIADQQVLNGSLPPRALGLVTNWAKLHTAELQADWDFEAVVVGWSAAHA